MSRKDYQAIAAAIKSQTPLADESTASPMFWLERIAMRLADTLAQDNPRFDRARFLAACGF